MPFILRNSLPEAEHQRPRSCCPWLLDTGGRARSIIPHTSLLAAALGMAQWFVSTKAGSRITSFARRGLKLHLCAHKIIVTAILMHRQRIDEVEDLSERYMSCREAAGILGIHIDTVSRLVREGRIPGQMLSRRWIVLRTFVEEMAKTYEGRRGRPRKKRKYTRRNVI